MKKLSILSLLIASVACVALFISCGEGSGGGNNKGSGNPVKIGSVTEPIT